MPIGFLSDAERERLDSFPAHAGVQIINSSVATIGQGVRRSSDTQEFRHAGVQTRINASVGAIAGKDTHRSRAAHRAVFFSAVTICAICGQIRILRLIGAGFDTTLVTASDHR